jgi:hypothetical protein
MIDHDRLFKELLTCFFYEFVELFLPDAAAYLSRKPIVFLDKEVFTDVTTGTKHEADLVAKVKCRNRNAFFLFHLEHSAQPPRLPPPRMFGYFSVLHARYGLPVYPVVIFSHGSRRPQPGEYRVAFPDLDVLHFRYRVIQLPRLNWREFVRRPNPVASALMATMGMAPHERPRVKLECLRLLVTLRLDAARMKLISGFVDTYLRLNRQEILQFEREADRLLNRKEKARVMEVTTSWKEEGIAIGRKQGLERGLERGLQQGLEQGRAEGSRETVLRVLNRRWGTLPPTVERRLRKLTMPQVQQLAEVILDFSSPNDLKRWLAAR